MTKNKVLWPASPVRTYLSNVDWEIARSQKGKAPFIPDPDKEYFHHKSSVESLSYNWK